MLDKHSVAELHLQSLLTLVRVKRAEVSARREKLTHTASHMGMYVCLVPCRLGRGPSSGRLRKEKCTQREVPTASHPGRTTVFFRME